MRDTKSRLDVPCVCTYTSQKQRVQYDVSTRPIDTSRLTRKCVVIRYFTLDFTCTWLRRFSFYARQYGIPGVIV